jgi:hypothetical protein
MKGAFSMKFIKLTFKIIAAPLVLALTIITPIVTFLFCYAEAFLQIVSGIGVLIGAVLIFTGQYWGGGVILFLAFLLSPLGLPAVAEWLIDKLGDFNYSLRDFIMS